MRPGDRTAKERLSVPSWWDDRSPKPRKEQAGQTESDRPGAARSWLGKRIIFRLPRSTLIALGGAVVGVVVMAFLLGRFTGRQTASELYLDLQRSGASFDDVRAGEPNRSLIPSSVPRVGTGGEAPPPMLRSDDTSEPDAPSPPGRTASASSAGDPRQPGLNYFRLLAIPASARSDGERAVAFLADHGIDAALIPVNNGRFLKLVVLEGFESPRTDARAQRLKDRLRALGREWKAEHRGGADWQDLLAEKYKPGVN